MDKFIPNNVGSTTETLAQGATDQERINIFLHLDSEPVVIIGRPHPVSPGQLFIPVAYVHIAEAINRTLQEITNRIHGKDSGITTPVVSGPDIRIGTESEGLNRLVLFEFGSVEGTLTARTNDNGAKAHFPFLLHIASSPQEVVRDQGKEYVQRALRMDRRKPG